MTELRRPLSEREIQVARLVAKGWCYKDIGRELQINSGTVRVHVNNIDAILPWDSNPNLPAYKRVMLWTIEHREKLVA